MARPKKNKVRINIKIDTELKQILDRKHIEKSALINQLLWKYIALEKNSLDLQCLESPISNPNSHKTKLSTQWDSNPRLAVYKDGDEIEIGDKRVEKSKNEEFLFLKRVYETHKVKLESWFSKKGYSHKHKRNVLAYLAKIFDNSNKCNCSIKTVILEGVYSKKHATLSFRVFLNYLEEHQLINKQFLELLRDEIKIVRSKGCDTYIPPEKNIKESIELLKEKGHKYSVFYRLLLESGARFTELKHMLLYFDPNKLEFYDDVAVYRNFYIRGNKSSYYLFFTSKLIHEAKKYMSVFQEKQFYGRFERIIKQNKSIVRAKYLRKYQFTKLIQGGVSFEISNFLQGRASNNIGMNHYLNMKEIAVKEYAKPNVAFNQM